MHRFSYAGGAALAIFCAGPIFVLPLPIGELLFDPQPWGGTSNPLMWIMLMIPAAIFGTLFALLPVTLGGLAMGWAGTHWVPARHPAAWGFAGAIVGLAMAAGLGGDDAPALALFAATGTACALIVRYRTRWYDDGASA